MPTCKKWLIPLHQFGYEWDLSRVRSTMEGSQAFAEKDGEASLVAQFPGTPEFKEVEEAVQKWLEEAV